jgi:BirA family biotin operon repressor/biotin-[acetyl-CoA-carboxylase] ligase
MSGRLMNSLIGIGINVNQEIFLSDAPNPVSLKMLTKMHFDVGHVLSEILSEIDFYYEQLRGYNFQAINVEFESVLYRLNEPHFYKTDNEVFEGVILGVNSIGQLVIRKNNGQILEFHFKEVEFIQT